MDEPEPTFVQISKLEAAKRQLEVSVRLFFAEGDPVSIHTLATASLGILSDLADGRGLSRGLLESSLDEWVRPERKNEVRRLFRSAQNFFKHADRDPDEVFQFNPVPNGVYLFDACVQYQVLANETPPAFVVMSVWFQLDQPDLFRDKARHRVIEGALENLLDIRDPRNKRPFLELLELLE